METDKSKISINVAGGDDGGPQQGFGALELLSVILERWVQVTSREMCLSHGIQNTKIRPCVNCELWVTQMCQCDSPVPNTWTTLVERLRKASCAQDSEIQRREHFPKHSVRPTLS